MQLFYGTTPEFVWSLKTTANRM